MESRVDIRLCDLNGSYCRDACRRINAIIVKFLIDYCSGKVYRITTFSHEETILPSARLGYDLIYGWEGVVKAFEFLSGKTHKEIVTWLAPQKIIVCQCLNIET